MNEILPSLFQLQIPLPNNPLGHTNIYLIHGDDGDLLIDAGFNSPEGLEAMQKQLAETGADIRKISRIIITHAHGDHIGLAGKVREISGAKIALHRLEKPPRFPAGRDREAFVKQAEKWLHASGMPHDELLSVPEGPRHGPGGMRPFESPPKPDATLEDNEDIRTGGFNLKVVWTPGHSPGHICLYEANNRVLFGGDHVLPTTTPNIGLRPGQLGRGNPLSDYLESLDKVRKLDVRRVLPAHEHIFKDLPGRVDEIKEHHRRRSQEILDTLHTGPKTGYQVSGAVTWMPESGGGVNEGRPDRAARGSSATR